MTDCGVDHAGAVDETIDAAVQTAIESLAGTIDLSQGNWPLLVRAIVIAAAPIIEQAFVLDVSRHIDGTVDAG